MSQVLSAMCRQLPMAKKILVQLTDLRRQLEVATSRQEWEGLGQQMAALCGGLDPAEVETYLQTFCKALETNKSLEAASAWVKAAPIIKAAEVNGRVVSKSGEFQAT